MAISEQRKKAGAEIVKKYQRAAGDKYAAAADAIADILMSVAENEDEAVQIVQAAEADFRSALELETFGSEG